MRTVPESLWSSQILHPRSTHWSTWIVTVNCQVCSRGNRLDSLHFLPGELLQQLVKCFVVKLESQFPCLKSVHGFISAETGQRASWISQWIGEWVHWECTGSAHGHSHDTHLHHDYKYTRSWISSLHNIYNLSSVDLATTRCEFFSI